MMLFLKLIFAKRSRIALLFLILALGVTTTFFVSGAWLRNPYPVKTALVAKGNIQSFITVSGSLISPDDISLASPVAGRLTSISVKEGDVSVKGQTLLQFDARDLLARIDDRQAALRAALEVQRAAKHDWQALIEVQALGGESEKTVEDARLKWRSALDDGNTIALELKRHRLELERFSVKSPISGIITAAPANLGTWVNQGEVLLKLSGSAGRQIEVKVDSGDTNSVSPGKLVTLSSETYPGIEWTEKIAWIAPATKKEGSSNTLAVRIPLSTRAPDLTLGQQIDVKIPTVSASDVLVIPTAAVSTRQEKPSVAILDNGTIRFVPVSLGVSEQKTTEVRKGLSAGQMVVLPDGKPMKDGDKAYSEASERKAA